MEILQRKLEELEDALTRADERENALEAEVERLTEQQKEDTERLEAARTDATLGRKAANDFYQEVLTLRAEVEAYAHTETLMQHQINGLESEVERLREALEKIADCRTVGRQQIARAALSQEKK
jgi:predicted  nucleic acid-binding Zn-ribbon protein